MVCKFCGREIAEGAKFCTVCGKPVQASVNNNVNMQQKPPADMYVAPYQPQVQSTYAAQPNGTNVVVAEPKKSRKKLVIAIIAVIAALAVALAGVFAYVKAKDSESVTEKVNSAASDEKSESSDKENTTKSYALKPEEITVGFIALGDENSTYDKNFVIAAKEACKNKGVSIIVKTNVNENQECYDAAAELADEGCDIVFADSYGHEDYMIQAAKEFTDIQFIQASGTKAHTENLSNYHNVFASVYEGKYLTGIAAGMKLNEMIDNGKITADKAKMGYVGAYTYAEVISGYTAFYLGAKSVCPSVTMDVTFTGSWYDETAEKEAAQNLINEGCVLISQYSDSMGAPTACEAAGVPNISYNGSTVSACPNTFIVSSRINWQPCFEYVIDCLEYGKEIDTDWTGTLSTDSVVLTDVNEKAAAKGTQDAIDAAEKKLENGSLHVFDTSTFTISVSDSVINVNASVDSSGHLTGYMADVDTDVNYEGDTQVVKDGYFHESESRSAPYFDIQIDGITLLNSQF